MTGISRRELIRKFRVFEFVGPYSGGKHQFMMKGSKKVHIPNPHGQDIGEGLLKEILKQADIQVEDWNKI